MANEVDERIVAAKFDSSDFEKGVDKTIKKLDELKSSLNMKESGESIAELSKKTSDAAKSMDQSMEKLTDRITTFTGMLKQKLLSGLADEVVGVFFRMENAVKGFIRSVSTDQISAGMSKYEQILTSVRMMTAAGRGQKESYEAIEQLRDYSDETSYSLSQMTDAMSKMVAAGVELDTATKSVQGIANACAVAGVNAYDAQRAFFNLSQAYSSGFLKYTDYRSLQLLNMTNEKFEEQLLEAAVTAGTLKKVKDGVYKTKKSDTNKKVTAGKQVTRKNLQDALRYNFVDNKVMNTLFGEQFYVNVEEYKKEYKELTDAGLDNAAAIERLKKKYGEVAVTAFNAAREARNFTDVLNTLKDVVATGWSKTWEYLFGQLDKATDFFTKLAEGGIADAIYAIGTWRNEVLESWNSGGFGGDAFRESILYLDEAAGNLLGILTDLLPASDDFGFQLSLLTSDLVNSMDAFNQWTIVVRNWFRGSPEGEKGITRIQKIQTIMGNLGSVFGIAAKAVSIAVDAFSKALDLLSPIIDATFDALMGLTKPISDLNNDKKPFQDLADTIENFFIVISPIVENLKPVISTLGTILGGILEFVASSAITTATMNLEFFSDALGLLIEALGFESAQKKNGEGVLDRIQKGIQDIQNACTSALSAVNEFFGALIDDLRELFGLPAKEGKEVAEGAESGGFFAGIKNFFDTNTFIKNAEEWLVQAKADIAAWFEKLPENIGNFFHRLFYREGLVEDESKKGEIKYSIGEVETPFKQWLDSVVESVKTFIKELPDKTKEWANNIKNAVKQFINGLFYESITDVETTGGGKAGAKGGRTIKGAEAPLKRWLKGVIETIKKFIKELPQNIIKGVKAVGEVGKTLIDIVKDLFIKPDETEAKAKEAVEGISWKSIIQSIKDIGLSIFNTITSWFTGTDDLESNIAWFSDEVSGFIKSIPGKLWNGVTTAITGLGNLWNRIFAALTGQKTEQETGAPASKVSEYINGLFGGEGASVYDAIVGIPGLLKAAFLDAGEIIQNLWNNLIKIISGEQGAKATSMQGKDLQSDLLEQEVSKLSKWDQIAQTISQKIIEIFSQIPGWITDGLTMAIGGINAAIAWFTQTIAQLDPGQEVNDTLAENVEASEEDKALAGKMLELGEAIKKLLLDTIPGFITTAFTTMRDNWETTWKPAFLGIFDNAINNKDLKEKIEGIGDNIVEWINGLPAVISKAFDDLTKTINGILNPGDKKQAPELLQVDKKTTERNAEAIYEEYGVNVKDGAKKAEPTILDSITSIAENIKQAFITAFNNIQPSVTNFLKNIPVWIADGVNLAITGIDSAFNAMVDFFNQNTTVEEMQKALEEETNETGKTFGSIGQGLEDGEANSESALIKSLKRIGASIWRLISETIPGFIVGGFNYVKENWQTWIEPIKTLFDQVDWASIQIDISALGLKIKEAILNLPETIRNAWGDAKELIATVFSKESKPEDMFSKKGQKAGPLGEDPLSWFEQQVPKPKEVAEPVAEEFKVATDAAGEAAKEGTEDSSFWDVIQEIGKTLGDVIASAFDAIGPAVIRGWNTTLDMINKLLTSMGLWFSGKAESLGDAIKGIFGEDTSAEMQSSLTGIGETITKFFVETIPSFLGNAIGKLVADLPGMWKSFWESFDESFSRTSVERNKDVEKQQSATDAAVEAATESTKSMTNIFDVMMAQLMSNKLEKGVLIVGGIIAVMKILEMLRELINVFNITGNWADRMEAKNSIGAVFRTMLNAVIAAMALVAYTSTLDDTKFEHAKEILTIIKEMITTIAGMYTVGSLGGTILNVFGDKKETKAADGAIDAVTKTLSRTDKLKDAFTKGVGNLFTWAGTSLGISFGVETVGGSISDVIRELVARFEEIGAAVRVFSEKINEAIGNIEAIKGNVDTAIEVIRRVGLDEDGLLSVIGKIGSNENRGAVETARETLTSITGPLILLANAFSGDIHATEITQALTELMGMTDKMSEFVEFTEKDNTFDLFKYALSSLGSALSYYGSVSMIPNISKVTSIGLDNAVVILKHILGDDELMGLAAQLSSSEFSGDTKDMFSAAEKLTIFAGALSTLGKAATLFGAESGDNMKSFLEAIDDSIPEDNRTEGTERVTSFAQRMATLGKGLSSFTSSITGIDEGSVKTAEYALNVLAAIAERAQYFGKGILTSWFTGSSDLSEFGLGIEVIGSNLGAFLKSIEFDQNGKQITWNFDTLQTVMFALQQLSTAASKIGTGGVNALNTLSNNLPSLGQNLMKFFDSMTFVAKYGEDGVFKNLTTEKFDAKRYDFDWIESIIGIFERVSGALGALNKGNKLNDTMIALLGDGTQGGLWAMMQKVLQTFRLITYWFEEYADADNGLTDEASKIKGTHINIDVVNAVIEPIATLFEGLGKVFAMKEITMGMDVVAGTAAMGTIIDSIEQLNTNIPLLQEFFTNMKIFDAESGVVQAQAVFTAIKTLGEGLASFTKDYTGRDPMDGILNILSLKPEQLSQAIQNLMTGLQLAMDDQTTIPELSLTPVLHLEDAKAQLADFFGMASGETVDMSFGAMLGESLRNALMDSQNKPIDYTEQLNNLNERVRILNIDVNSLGEHMDYIGNQINGMAVLMDGDALVGQIGGRISSWLAQDQRYFNNQNATGTYVSLT